jgi:hypothetical protein
MEHPNYVSQVTNCYLQTGIKTEDVPGEHMHSVRNVFYGNRSTFSNCVGNCWTVSCIFLKQTKAYERTVLTYTI